MWRHRVRISCIHTSARAHKSGAADRLRRMQMSQSRSRCTLHAIVMQIAFAWWRWARGPHRNWRARRGKARSGAKNARDARIDINRNWLACERSAGSVGAYGVHYYGRLVTANGHMLHICVWVRQGCTDAVFNIIWAIARTERRRCLFAGELTAIVRIWWFIGTFQIIRFRIEFVHSPYNI